jgi:hypothetical protein
MASQVGDESLEVEIEGARVPDQVSQAKAILVCELQIVHLPEPALRTGCLGRFGRLVGMRVDLRQRKVAIREPQVVPHDLPNLFEDRMSCAAKRALVVAVLDECYWSRRRPQYVIPLTDRYGQSWTFENDGHAGTEAAAIDSSAARIPSAPGLTPIGDRWLQRMTPSSSMTNSARSLIPMSSS